MHNRVVTVFGGTGFLGRHVVRKLAERGARIVVISRNPERGRHLQPLGEVGQIVCVPANLKHEKALEGTLRGSWGVVNLVGILTEGWGHRFDAIQGVLPGRIAHAAQADGVARMVHVSAIGANAHSASAYARSKAHGEASIHGWLRNATVLRPSIVVGPEDGFFNLFAGMARFSPVLPLIGGGQTRFQPVYVGDVADAVVAALEQEDAQGKTYELGGPTVYTFKELLEYMLSVVQRRRKLLSYSFELARLQASVLEWLPMAPLTQDQVELLKIDNVVSEGALTLADLGITPTPIEVVVPTYLARYRADVPKVA